MPLSRGSAVVGFAVMLGLFLAANMEFTGSIPQGCQVDWEAILSLDPNSFVDSVKSWLYPSLKVTTSWKDYHDVASTFATTGSVVAALSSSDDCTPWNNGQVSEWLCFSISFFLNFWSCPVVFINNYPIYSTVYSVSPVKANSIQYYLFFLGFCMFRLTTTLLLVFHKLRKMQQNYWLKADIY